MMVAKVPTLLSEAAAWIGAIVVVVSGLTLLFTRKPFKWLGRKLFSEPFGGWVQRRVEDGTKDLRHLTTYHLGPNGSTPPLHTRIAVLEAQAVIRSWVDDLANEIDETEETEQ